MAKSLSNIPVKNSRNLNIYRALEYIRAQTQITTIQLSEDLEIPIATSYRIMQRLIENGLIVLAEKQDSSYAGRRAGIYTVDSSYKYMLGIYMEKSYLNVFIVDMCGNIPDLWREYYAKDVSLEHVLSMLDRGIKHVTRSFFGENVGLEKIDMIGFAAEAAVESSSGKIIAFSSLVSMNGFGIKEYMEKEYGLTTHVMKSVHLRAYMYLNELKKFGLDNYLYLSIGNGVGASIIMNGELFEGSHGNAGELESMELDEQHDQINIYRAYATQGVYRRTNDYFSNAQDPKLLRVVSQKIAEYTPNSESYEMKRIDAALEYGDPYVKDLVDQLSEGWARLANTLMAFYDPELMIIGGEITSDTPHVFQCILMKIKSHDSIERKIIPASKENTKLKSLAARLLDFAYEEVYRTLNDKKI